MPSERKTEGILMPMPVAFKQDGAIDYKATDAIIDFYLDAGVHGFFPLGTHGQGMVMEIDERKKVAEHIVQRRIDENRQQLAELLARAVGGLHGIVTARLGERTDGFEQGGAMLDKRDDVGISGHEEDPRTIRPDDAFGRHVPNVAGERHGRARL